MKKAVIVALAALNVGLLVWVMTMQSAPAHAQMNRNAKDFLQVSGKIGPNAEAIYILDATSRTLKGWYYSTSGNRSKLEELRGRDLSADFKRGGRN